MTDKSDTKIAPWIHGVVEGMAGALLLHESGFPQRNRLAVLLLDSALETAVRAFLRYKAKIRLTEAHKNRENLFKVVRSNLQTVDPEVWDTLDYYYQEVRCELYHESAGKTITDDAFLDYKESVEFVVDQMFNIRSESLARVQCRQAADSGAAHTQSAQSIALQLHSLDDPVEKVIVAVGAQAPKKVDEINEFLRKSGDSYRLEANEFTNILARNSRSKKFFYDNKELKVWQLSGLGEYRFSQLRLEMQHE